MAVGDDSQPGIIEMGASLINKSKNIRSDRPGMSSECADQADMTFAAVRARLISASAVPKH